MLVAFGLGDFRAKRNTGAVDPVRWHATWSKVGTWVRFADVGSKRAVRLVTRLQDCELQRYKRRKQPKMRTGEKTKLLFL